MAMRFLFDQDYFENPAEIISCRKLSEVKNCFGAMEKALAGGNYLAGFLSYEAGYAFEECFRDHKTYAFPLVCFGVYSRPASFSTHPPSPSLRKRRGENFKLTQNNSPSLRKRGGQGVSYQSALRKIKRHLAAGETYQVNYTFKQKFAFRGDPFQLYLNLKKRQPTPYSAFIETDAFSILSLTPELFFRKRGEKILVKPMKGTIGLGKGAAKHLRNDPKNQAENLMIVDLLRNDLGRIARTGSVKTVSLFNIEKHPTLYQMTSTIEAKIPKKIELYALFKSVFPSGSVTGAPKIRTMQIIRELEKGERKIYCGSIGFITPQRDMLFNVAIRTLLLTSCRGEMGVGSGIVYDSDPEKEFEECLLKAEFLTRG
jgi:para-aminobenzoate synthetase/4-amino-4-deoxychorismate lyase